LINEIFEFVFKDEVFNEAFELYENTYEWFDMSKTVTKMLDKSNSDN